MRTRTVLAMAAALLFPAAGWPDALWDRAVTVTRTAVDWVPGSASFLLELVDAKGAAQESWRSRFRITGRPDGTLGVEVVSASHNSEDTTAKEQENQRKRKQGPLPRWDNPFDPGVQASVSTRAKSMTELVQGRSCALYDFTIAREDGAKIAGSAWIDGVSGAPVQVVSYQTPLPRGVFSMTTTLRFGSGPAGEGFLREASVEGAGGLLFIRRSFRSTVTVGDYWMPAQKPPSP